VQRYVRSNGAYSPEESSPGWVFVDMFRPSIHTAIEREQLHITKELAFRLFRETGSAYAVVQRFSERGLRFPKRAYGGAWDGKLVWGRLTHSPVLSILKNPSHARM
jgi:hypothetical protein